MFKVVPDQLKISDGWVRCGHCADVFDATLYLDEWKDADAPSPVRVDDPAPAPAPAPAAQPVLSRTESAVVQPAPVSASAPWNFDDESPGEILSGFAPLDDVRPTEPMPLPDRVSDALARALSEQARAGTEPSPSDIEAAGVLPVSVVSDVPKDVPRVRPRRGVTEDFHAELLQFASSAGTGDPAAVDAVDVPIGLPLHADEPEPVVPKASAMPRESSVLEDPRGDEPEPVPQFVQQARRKAFWRRPLVRAMLSLTALMLAAVLLAQWAHHERHRLLAWQPPLEPVLRLMCAPPDCEIGPVRRIDDIVIDSAALVRRLGNFYSFDIVLKNRSDVPLAVPALELTLTDTRDQTIARRVFLPTEWPEQPIAVPARGSIAVNLRLAIELGDGVPMAGYRALVFYP